ncbi:Vegetative incompatibility protein HET-E-1 [Ceratobasidium theobromae]|uniref:Vegetative incompatibility protein HET-E-1 n=1 Tax=Ceratobasidium theobromae TaxID=1582974 RepID=A0A5N5QF25_9AGAM|nr:Vegetative incompatibility protein HET-E-1 [Ceratobasidium theobromae]
MVSDSHFIYAATAVRYIFADDVDVDTKGRLKKMLAVDFISNLRFGHINRLYSTILVGVLDNQKFELDERERRKLALWTVVCVQKSVSINTLVALAGLVNEDQAWRAIQPLRSVLHVSTRNSSVSALHASFPDYLFDKTRSEKFFCDSKKHNQLVARRCFDIMKAQLKFNICDLEPPSVPDEETQDLKTRIEEKISQELFYVCRFWVDHLRLTEMSEELGSMLNEFLSQRLLFWMEVMNLKDCMITGLAELLKCCTSMGIHQICRCNLPES